MGDRATIRVDEGRWDRLVELTGGAIQTCADCGVCDAVCRWELFPGRGPDIPRLLRNAQLGSRADAALEEPVWRCTTCASCEGLCPEGVSIPEILLGLRGLAVEDGRVPAPLAGVGPRPDFGRGSSGPGAMDWTLGFGLPRVSRERSLLVYFGTEARYHPRLQRVARALRYTLEAADVRFGVLEDEPDSGIAELVLGSRERLAALVEANVRKFHEAGVWGIVVLSPHDYDVFRRLYSGDNGDIRAFHVTAYLSELVEYDLLRFGARHPLRVLYHDPCYLGRHHGLYTAPRRLLRQMRGLQVKEFLENREDAVCCGGGGGRIWLEEEPGENFADLLVREAVDRGIDVVATACPYCIEMLEDSAEKLGFDWLEVYDVVELAARWRPYAPRPFQDPVFRTCNTA